MRQKGNTLDHERPIQVTFPLQGKEWVDIRAVLTECRMAQSNSEVSRMIREHQVWLDRPWHNPTVPIWERLFAVEIRWFEEGWLLFVEGDDALCIGSFNKRLQSGNALSHRIVFTDLANTPAEGENGGE